MRVDGRTIQETPFNKQARRPMRQNDTQIFQPVPPPFWPLVWRVDSFGGSTAQAETFAIRWTAVEAVQKASKADRLSTPARDERILGGLLQRSESRADHRDENRGGCDDVNSSRKIREVPNENARQDEAKEEIAGRLRTVLQPGDDAVDGERDRPLPRGAGSDDQGCRTCALTFRAIQKQKEPDRDDPALFRRRRQRRSDPSQQDEDQHDNEHRTDQTRRAVTPSAAIAPVRNCADQGQNENDEKNGAESHLATPLIQNRGGLEKHVPDIPTSARFRTSRSMRK